MKTCAYCGRENHDEAVGCAECGGSDFKTDAAPPRRESPAPDVQAPALRLRDLLTDQPRLFRVVVVAGAISHVLSLLAPYAESYFMSDESLTLLRYGGYGALLPIPSPALWLIWGIYLVTALGLYHFLAAARTLFLILTVASMIIGLLGGIYVGTAFTRFFSAIATLTDGAVLVLAYGTPLKERFK